MKQMTSTIIEERVKTFITNAGEINTRTLVIKLNESVRKTRSALQSLISRKEVESVRRRINKQTTIFYRARAGQSRATT